MSVPSSLVPEPLGDQVLEAFGETGIIRREPLGAPLDVSVIEEITPPGVFAPWRRHTREDEMCYVIEGAVRIWRGEEMFDIGPGGVALLPRHQAHAFGNVGSELARIMTVINPAGLERLFQAAAERGLGEDDLEEIAAVAAEFGLEILGPPPE